MLSRVGVSFVLVRVGWVLVVTFWCGVFGVIVCVVAGQRGAVSMGVGRPVSGVGRCCPVSVAGQ